MTVDELIQIFKDVPADAEVVLTIARRTEDGDLETESWDVKGVVPFDAEGDDDAEVWLVSGEDDDVDALFEELEAEDSDEESED